MKSREDMSSSSVCVFCQIIQGKVDAEIVFRDNASMAFLDAKPLFHGHCLLIPVHHYETLLDMPGNLIGPLFTNVRLLANAVQTAMAADGTFVATNNKVSQSVPHLHVHIVPRKRGDGLHGFFWPRQRYATAETVTEVADKIRRTIEEIQSQMQTDSAGD